MKATVVRNKFQGIDWYCDNCNACLTDQPGFVDTCGSWTCTNCGYTNQINEEEIGYYQDYSPKTGDFTILFDDKEYFDNFVPSGSSAFLPYFFRSLFNASILLCLV